MFAGNTSIMNMLDTNNEFWVSKIFTFLNKLTKHDNINHIYDKMSQC